MKRENPKTFIEEFSSWAVNLKFEQIPPKVIEKAKLQILSVLSAIFSSSQTRAGKLLCESAYKFFGKGKFPVLGVGKKFSLQASLFSWAGLSVAQDYDDYLLFGHTGHSAVSTSLLLGAELKKSPKEILTAQVIANEVEGRLGASVLLGPHNGQGWSFIHLAGSALAGARLFELDEEKTANALAISLYQPTYLLWSGFMGPDSKLLTSAVPTILGIQAVYLAEQGFSGAWDIIESPQGFLNHFSYYPLPFMLSGLGKAWTTYTLAYKIYPGCAYIDTAIDATLEILNRYQKDTGKELAGEEISEITVEATALTVEMDRLSQIAKKDFEFNPIRINFSIPASIALAILHKRLTGAELREENINQNLSLLKSIARKVKLIHNLNMTVEMIREMSPYLKLRELIRRIELIKLFQAQRRIQNQYQRGTAIEWNQFFRLLVERRKSILEQVENEFKERIRGWLQTEKSQPQWALEMADLENFKMPFSAKVSIRLKNGTVYSHKQDLPRAGAGSSLEEQKALVKQKFLTEAGAVVGKKQAEKIAEKILNLENQTSIKNILEELVESG